MHAVQRFVLLHRRSLAALFAGLAVLAALTALKPPPSGDTVVVARRDLTSGMTIEAGDLRTVRLSATPSHAHTTTADLIGQRVAGPMREGEVLTDYRLLETAMLDGYEKGSVLATVRLAQGDPPAGLRVGGHVDVVGIDPQGEVESTVVARRAEIAALPDNDERPSVVLVVPGTVGLELATAGQRAKLDVLSVP